MGARRARRRGQALKSRPGFLDELRSRLTPSPPVSDGTTLRTCPRGSASCSLAVGLSPLVTLRGSRRRRQWLHSFEVMSKSAGWAEMGSNERVKRGDMEDQAESQSRGPECGEAVRTPTAQ